MYVVGLLHTLSVELKQILKTINFQSPRHEEEKKLLVLPMRLLSDLGPAPDYTSYELKD